MSELDLVSQIQSARSNIALILSLVMTALSVMVVATHYFLGKEGLLVRIAVFAVFTGGYVALLSLYHWEIVHVRGALIELVSLAASDTLSSVGAGLLAWSGGPWQIQSWLPPVMYFAGWFLVGIYLFWFGQRK